MKQSLLNPSLFLILIIVGPIIFFWITNIVLNARKYKRLKPQLDNLDRAERYLTEKTTQVEASLQIREIELSKKELVIMEIAEQKSRQQIKELEEMTQAAKQKLKEKETAFELIAKEKTIGFPWLATAYADFCHLQEMKIADWLENKPRPAYTAAENVREAGRRRREAERMARIYKYQIEYYENLFPWLVDLKSEEIEDELIRINTEGITDENADDPAKNWLTAEEYDRLPSDKKFQLALDRYWQKRKSRWEIGRDYERYVGYLFENEGWKVQYQGIIEGFDDLGRDLILLKRDEIQIVQCKYWSREKVIHEKHVCQLYGTMTAFEIDNPGILVSGHLITSTTLSDRARRFAKQLQIKVTQTLPLQPYPCIKCNISHKDGERIYHLPFDQQYDKTIIETNRGEHYAMTVRDAESHGFRRAFKYRGEQ